MSRHAATEARRHAAAIERFGDLPYRMERVTGVGEVVFKVELIDGQGHVLTEIQSDSNVNGVLGVVQRELEEAMERGSMEPLTFLVSWQEGGRLP